VEESPSHWVVRHLDATRKSRPRPTRHRCERRGFMCSGAPGIGGTAWTKSSARQRDCAHTSQQDSSRPARTSPQEPRAGAILLPSRELGSPPARIRGIPQRNLRQAPASGPVLRLHWVPYPDTHGSRSMLLGSPRQPYVRHGERTRRRRRGRERTARASGARGPCGSLPASRHARALPPISERMGPSPAGEGASVRAMGDHGSGGPAALSRRPSSISSVEPPQLGLGIQHASEQDKGTHPRSGRAFRSAHRPRSAPSGASRIRL